MFAQPLRVVTRTASLLPVMTNRTRKAEILTDQIKDTGQDLLEVAIFSYNRPTYLKNCYESVKRNLPFAKVKIYDDGSDDPDLLNFLRATRSQAVVDGDSAASKHGGLYHNMQEALDRTEARYLLLLQDDMQVVRKVDREEFEALTPHFGNHPLMSVNFMKGEREKRVKTANKAGQGVYEPRLDARGEPHRNANCYMDIALCDVDRLRRANWKVLSSEAEMARVARRDVGGMNHFGNPFVFYCPQVPFFRDRRQPLSARLANRFTKGPVFFNDLSDSENQRFQHRDISEWPIAENWLTPTIPNIRRPFVYQDARSLWWTDVIYGIERHYYNRRRRSKDA